MRFMYGAPPAPGNARDHAPVPQGPTVHTHPNLGWKRLQGTVQTARGPMSFNYGHVLFTIMQHDGSVYIHAYSERNGARMDRPCSNPNMAFARVLDWARNYSLRQYYRNIHMSYKTKPGYSADDQATITSEVPDIEDGAIAYASLEQTSWQLSVTSSATLSSSVIATRSGVGRWIKIATASDVAGFDFILGIGTDGARTVTGTVAALATSVNYTNLTVDPNGQLPCGGYPVICTGTLTMGANSALRNDGSSVAANTQAGGASAPAGEITLTISNGSNGGAASGSGTGVAGLSTWIGGSGGQGGAGGVGAGGAVGANTPPSGLLGRMLFHLGLLFRQNGTFSRVNAGQGGSGGGGGAASTGSGGGGGGGGCLVIAKSIVMATGSRISSNGGNGGSNSLVNGGGGGGGGGGFTIVMCDNLSIADSYASHFQSSGGSGGVASGGGASGANGSSGKVFVFVRGTLVYSSPLSLGSVVTLLFEA